MIHAGNARYEVEVGLGIAPMEFERSPLLLLERSITWHLSMGQRSFKRSDLARSYAAGGWAATVELVQENLQRLGRNAMAVRLRASFRENNRLTGDPGLSRTLAAIAAVLAPEKNFEPISAWLSRHAPEDIGPKGEQITGDFFHTIAQSLFRRQCRVVDGLGNFHVVQFSFPIIQFRR